MFDLKRFRKDKSITQKVIEELFDCSQSFISQIENGVKELPEENFKKLLQNYGKEVYGYIIEVDKSSPDNISMPEIEIERLKNSAAEKDARIAELKDQIDLQKEMITMLRKELAKHDPSYAKVI